MSLDELMNVEVISVSKRPEKLSDAPSAIQVVTSEDIRRSGASSIPEALREADNLQVAQKGSHAWGITARGFNTDLANKLLVMIDGRTVYTPLYSGVFWDRQDYLLEDIERIEVVSGPGGTLWGANAVNGVINIQTKSAKDTQGMYVEGGGGNELQSFAGARFGGTLSSNTYYRVYAKYFDRDSAVFADGTDASDSWRMGQSGFRIDSIPSTANTLTLQGDYYNGAQGVPSGSDAEVAGGNILARWSHTFSEDSQTSLQIYGDWTHFATPVPALVLNSMTFAPPGSLKDDLGTYDVDFQHRLNLGSRNQVVWGLGYRFTHDKVNNAPAVGFFPPTLEQHLVSGFVQDEIAIVERLSLTLGTKIEHNDYTGWEFEPSVRVAWSPANHQTIWGSVSRAVRAPSRIDRDLSQASPPHLVILKGGSDFDSETVIAYELGHRVQFGTKLTTSLSLFYNDYDNIRSTSLTPGTVIPFFFENNVEGETYGLELSARYQILEWWRLHAGYTLLKEDLRVKHGEMDLNNALNETADPQQQVSMRSAWELPLHLEFDARLRWVDTLHNNNGQVRGTVPDYFELDLRLAWRPTKALEIAVVGQNLLHDHHPEYGFPSSTREEVQRGVYGKVSYRW